MSATDVTNSSRCPRTTRSQQVICKELLSWSLTKIEREEVESTLCNRVSHLTRLYMQCEPWNRHIHPVYHLHMEMPRETVVHTWLGWPTHFAGLISERDFEFRG
jgi:hypothetical protein